MTDRATAESANAGLSPERQLDLYATMWRIRLFEEQVLRLFNEGTVRGTAHPYVGEEAVATGACAALRSTDYVTSTHRGHGHALAKGLEPGPMLAEIAGRATGYCKGKGGSMHVASVEHGMLGADAVVGGSTGIAVGAALGARTLGRDDVVVCFFGDGALNQRLLSESMNLASVWRLPVVFVCENNLWALSTPASSVNAGTDASARGRAFGMPGLAVDGQDALAVHAAVRDAVERGRAGDGPTFVETKTYRFYSHSAFAAREVRPAEEIARWKARDPIAILGEHLQAVGIASEADLAETRSIEEQRIVQAVAFALSSPMADVEETYTDVLVEDGVEATRAGRDGR